MGAQGLLNNYSLAPTSSAYRIPLGSPFISLALKLLYAAERTLFSTRSTRIDVVAYSVSDVPISAVSGPVIHHD
jgi:hypothetical protein